MKKNVLKFKKGIKMKHIQLNNATIQAQRIMLEENHFGEPIYACKKLNAITERLEEEFIISEKTLNKMIEEGKFNKVNELYEYCLIDKKVLENFTKVGLNRWLKEITNRASSDNKPLMKESLTTIYIGNHLLDDNFCIGKIYLLNEEANIGTRVIKTEDGKEHVEPILMLENYRTGINDQDYKLDDLVESLSQRDDVALITYLDSFEHRNKEKIIPCPIKGNEEGLGYVIYDIQHHLEDGETPPLEKETVSFVYYPKKEDLDKIKSFTLKDERRQEYVDREIYSLERFIVKDVLGLHEFSIKPVEEKEPERKFKVKRY